MDQLLMRQWMNLFESAAGLKQQFNRWLATFNKTNGPVYVDLIVKRSDRIVIESISSDNKQQGHASKVMAMLCSMADRDGITLELQPVSYADYGEAEGGLGMDDLVMWYEKFGFEMDFNTGFMHRAA